MQGMGWLLRDRKKRQRCPRCSLKYDAVLSQCPHCSELDSQGLAQLKIRVEQNYRANYRLGKLFLYLAIALIISIVLINNQTAL